MQTTLRVAIIALSIVLGGCAGASSLPPVHAPPALPGGALNIWSEPSQLPEPSFVRFPKAAGPFVYGCGGRACVWYVKGHDKLAGEISAFSDAQGVGVSPVTGDIFVADDGRSDIKEYAPNSTMLVHRYLDPGQFPVDVAIDRAGNIFVANAVDKNSGPGSVTVYDASGKILRTLPDPNAFVGRSVAVDEHDLLMFCFNTRSGEGECDAFAHGRGPGVPMAHGIGYAGGAAFDASEHYVVIDEVNAVADTFDGSTLCGTYALAGSNVPVMVAFDRSSRILYNANTAVRGIAAYPYSDCGSGTLRPTIVYDDGLGPRMSMTGTAVTPSAGP